MCSSLAEGTTFYGRYLAVLERRWEISVYRQLQGFRRYGPDSYITAYFKARSHLRKFIFLKHRHPCLESVGIT
ncbi:hypothetical protein MAR_031893 [Mya arenaria]|uniref:Maturase K n=1 Tax=Mya arenaria TaxID=6604 RepID=A0ABY7F939_MYAAR|nr:hypothetical protein MAR_031893 [Mya arenaria]